MSPSLRAPCWNPKSFGAVQDIEVLKPNFTISDDVTGGAGHFGATMWVEP